MKHNLRKFTSFLTAFVFLFSSSSVSLLAENIQTNPTEVIVPTARPEDVEAKMNETPITAPQETTTDFLMEESPLSAVENETPVAARSEVMVSNQKEFQSKLSAFDHENAKLIFELVQGPLHGTLHLDEDGYYDYQAETGYQGSDEFTYRVFDGKNYSAVTSIKMTVTNELIPDIDLVVTLQPIQVCDDQGASCGNGDQEIDLKELNEIYASAGIRFDVLSFKKFNRSSFQEVNDINEWSDLINNPGHSQFSALTEQDPVVNVFFVDKLWDKLGGYANLSTSGLTVAHWGNEAASIILAHEIAHNLSLKDIDDVHNLLSGHIELSHEFDVHHAGEALSADQIKEIRSRTRLTRSTVRPQHRSAQEISVTENQEFTLRSVNLKGEKFTYEIVNASKYGFLQLDRWAESKNLIYSNTTENLSDSFRYLAINEKGERELVTVNVKTKSVNDEPKLTSIEQNLTDADLETPGIQIHQGSLAKYTARATDEENQELSWSWSYRVDNGEEILFRKGMGAIGDAVFDYERKSGAYEWILRVTDGENSVEDQFVVYVVAPSRTISDGVIEPPVRSETGLIYQVKQDGTGHFKTIQACVNQAQAGDTCEVASGRYDERIRTQRVGTADKRITIKANGNVTLAGFDVHHAYTTIQGFNLTGYAELWSSYVRIFSKADHVEILGNTIHGGRRSILEDLEFKEINGVGKTIYSKTGGFLASGFKPGMSFEVLTSQINGPNNGLLFKIKEVTDHSIVIEDLRNEFLVAGPLSGYIHACVSAIQWLEDSGKAPSYTLVRGNSVRDLDNQFFTVRGSHHTFENNLIEKMNGNTVFAIFGDDHVIQNNMIRDGKAQLPGYEGYTRILHTYTSSPLRNLRFAHNYVDGIQGSIFRLEQGRSQDRHHVYVEGNIFSHIGQMGIVRMPHVEITNNTFFDIGSVLILGSDASGSADHAVLRNNVLIGAAKASLYRALPGVKNLTDISNSIITQGWSDTFMNPFDLLGKDRMPGTLDDGLIPVTGSSLCGDGAGFIGAYKCRARIKSYEMHETKAVNQGSDAINVDFVDSSISSQMRQAKRDFFEEMSNPSEFASRKFQLALDNAKADEVPVKNLGRFALRPNVDLLEAGRKISQEDARQISWVIPDFTKYLNTQLKNLKSKRFQNRLNDWFLDLMTPVAELTQNAEMMNFLVASPATNYAWLGAEQMVFREQAQGIKAQERFSAKVSKLELQKRRVKDKEMKRRILVWLELKFIETMFKQASNP